jgi:amino acid transporter
LVIQIIAMTFIQCVAMSMAELCSSMPTSGGLYYAACVLAPPPYGPLAAWITGWSNWLAQVTGAPSVDYALSAMILAAGSVSNPDFVPQDYQVFLLTTLIMLIHGCISSMPTKWIAEFNSYGSTFNIVRTILQYLSLVRREDLRQVVVLKGTCKSNRRREPPSMYLSFG